MTAKPPTANFTTDEIAAQIRQTHRTHPTQALAIRPPAAAFARTIAERLPYIDPADIAAILIHASSYLATLMDAFAKGGLPDDRASLSAVNIVATAGEQMHRKAQRQAAR